MTKPVLLLAETGITLRNLVLGSFADRVLAHRPLVVSVPNPDDPRLAQITHGRQIRFVKYFLETTEAPRGRLDKLTRWQTYVHRFKIAEKTLAGAGSQLAFEGTSPSVVGKVAMHVIDRTGRVLARTGLMSRFEDVFLFALGRRPIAQQWRTLLREIDPSVVLSTTLTLTTKDLFSGDLPAVVAAQQLGLPVGTLVQSWDNLTNKAGVLPPDLDRYWTWNEHMTGELTGFYPRIDKRRVTIVGSPQFDFHRAAAADPRTSFMRQVGLDPARPFVLVGTGTPSRIPEEHLLAIEIATKLREVEPSLQVLIRLHPKDDGSRWQPLMDAVRAAGAVLQHTAPPVHMDQGGYVPAAEFYREQVSALTHAAVVVNSSSTLTVDAAILDRPVVCLAYDVGPDPKFPEGRAQLFVKMSHYAPLVATGGVRVVRSTPECVAAIREYLAHPELQRAERQKIVDIVAGTVDGGAGARLADEVIALAASRMN